MISSYLEVTVVEGMNNNDSRDLGKLEARVDELTQKVNDLTSATDGSNIDKLKQYKILNDMHNQVKTNKENIDKLAENSPEANIAESA
tara:strand:+ start:97 stop:360 length:264 start_codon:yes stop_codon:yes gene_type:complete